MSELTLEWSEQGQFHRHTLQDQYATKHPGVFRIGRDPAKCDLVLQDRSVSALHVEIFIHTDQRYAGLRNLRSTNPPLVDGVQLFNGEAPIRQGSHINLGRIELKVAALNFITPAPSAPAATPPVSDYGLKCPNPACGKVSAYSQEILRQGCPWCGFSLAAANSVVMIPPNR